jgi:hypothetical protein
VCVLVRLEGGAQRVCVGGRGGLQAAIVPLTAQQGVKAVSRWQLLPCTFTAQVWTGVTRRKGSWGVDRGPAKGRRLPQIAQGGCIRFMSAVLLRPLFTWHESWPRVR